MKKTIVILAFVLVAVCTVQAQPEESGTFYSDEFHFIAVFPEPPTRTEGNVETGIGKGFSRKWTLEQTDITYEVSVTDYPDLSVKPESESLYSFYRDFCRDLGGGYGVRINPYGATLEDFGQLGLQTGGRSNEKSVLVTMYLVGQRLYLVTVIIQLSREEARERRNEWKNFIDEFVFAHRSEDKKKFIYGFPQPQSQNRETR